MRRAATFFVVFLILAAWLLPQAYPSRAASLVARVRIGVTVDGITRITPASLAAAGIDVAAIDPRTFALSSLGQPVAIRVIGELDGSFDAGDEIQFFGQRFRGPEMDQKYTDERVYWLDIGGAAGPRILEVDAAPQGDLTPPVSFQTTLHAEQNNTWWTLHCLCLDTQDTWFWDYMQPLGAGANVTRTLPYTVPHPAAGFTATLRLEEISRSDVAGHITTIALNDTHLITQTWDWKQRRVFTMTVPVGLLASGVNTVTVGALNQPAASGAAEPAAWPIPLPEDDGMASLDGDPWHGLSPDGATTDWIYVNYWEVDYRRLFQAWQGQLDFLAETAGVQEFLSQGWTTPTTAIWDVSDPLLPRRLTGASAQGQPGGVELRFRADPAAGAHFWLQEEAAFRAPASVRTRLPTVLRDPAGGADAVIVTHADLRSAAESLAEWHRLNGRRALVVDLQDVVDEFNDGIYHPKAVPAMLAWAQLHWTQPGPRYLTLFGDGHWNFKGYPDVRYLPMPIFIPPYLAWADPWQGEVPSDTLYGDLNGDKLPDIAVGRIAVGSLEEANTVVNKIRAYDQGLRLASWQKRAIFVADRTDPNAGDFPVLSDSVILFNTPSDMQSQRIYLDITVPNAASARTAIASAINAGAFMIQYSGHGGPTVWSSDMMWHISNVSSLTNTAQLPLVMTFNCLDGYFVHPSGRDALAEVMHRKAGGGSIAAISPSGLGLTSDQHQFRTILLDLMFKERIVEMGEALRVAKHRYKAQGGADYLIATEMLFGDPALRAPRQEMPQPATLLSVRANAQTNGRIRVEWETATEPDTVAFTLYRAEAETGPWNTDIATLPAQGSGAAGASYAFVDHDVVEGKTYHYLLEERYVQGTSVKRLDWIRSATVPHAIRLPLLLRAS